MEGVSIEETEEGEVDDGSEPEDADSDPSSPTDGSRVVHNRGSRSVGTGTNFKSKVIIGNKTEHRGGFQSSEPQKLGISNSNATYSSFDKTPVKSVSDVSTSVSQSTQTKLPSEESKTVPKILRTEVSPAFSDLSCFDSFKSSQPTHVHRGDCG
ncbi:hypothetical protein FBUS_00374 [Fasciolopsis buskii]|uniref:Uncharacterized protein n=1 Tax=Fasciolopsis buskii TaxID=27845 RepID=A0A8E0VG37_9TREM|nr:hypothetical protein FBUS_00374 [Fasciolopsis buski]